MRYWVWLFCSTILACSGASEEPGQGAGALCVPNQTVECDCADGTPGVAECRADGHGYGTCSGCGAGTCQPPDCAGCTACFDTCVCGGDDASSCLSSCTGSGGSISSGGSGGSTSSGGSPSGGGTTSSGGSTSSGGTTGGGGCESCVAASCAAELQSCSATAGCLDLVLCAQNSGCYLDDIACLAIACGAYLGNFGAVLPAMSLGDCASAQCGFECS